MMNRSIFDEISDDEISEFADKYIAELESWEWKHEGNFKVFLDELEKYVLKMGRIDSEEFMYDSDKNPFSCKGEYYKYIESFCNFIFNYSDKYSLPCINENIEDNLCFNEYCLLLKYNNSLYKVERISGQGTVDIISVYDGDNEKYVIDYNRLIEDKSPENYKELLEMVLDNALDSFKSKFENQLEELGYDVELIKKRA